MKVGLLINYNAKKIRKKKITELKIRKFFNEDFFILSTYDVSEIKVAINKMLDKGIELLGLCGGDGTVHLCISELINSSRGIFTLPSLFILKGGTMNISAENLCRSRTLYEDLTILSILHNNCYTDAKWTDVSPLKFQCELWKEPKYGFLFGNGVSFNILNAYYENGEKSATRAFNLTASIIAGAFISKELEERYFKNIKTRILIDGSLFPYNEIKISVATPLPKLLLWFSPFDTTNGVREKDFYFLANAMSTSEIARRFWPLCRGKYQGERHFSGLSKKVIMGTQNGFTIDGEVYRVLQKINLTIEAGQLLKFLNLNSIELPKFSSDEKPIFPLVGAIV